MPKTGLVTDEFFKRHDTGPGHPERPARLDAIVDELTERGLMAEAEKIKTREATREELTLVHTEGHVDRIEATAGRDRDWLDGDTPASADSYKAALLAAGSLVNATDLVMDRELDNAFALVRPPGHHSEADRAMGFCLFNNVAVAAKHLVENRGIERILIIDWDVHHGNATQHSFYQDPRVLYFSTHRYPFYPGTGGMDETGSGEGADCNVNVPLPAGCDDAVFDAAFKRVLEPVARAYKPRFVFVSAGFDSHGDDPLGGMRVTEEGYARMARRSLELAREFAGGRLVLTLEGGYDLRGLANGVAEVTALCMGKSEAPKGDLEPDPGFDKLVEKARQYLGKYYSEI